MVRYTFYSFQSLCELAKLNLCPPDTKFWRRHCTKQIYGDKANPKQMAHTTCHAVPMHLRYCVMRKRWSQLELTETTK